MAKNLYGATRVYTAVKKGTSIGRRPNTSTMNKHKRRSFKKYRAHFRTNSFIVCKKVKMKKCVTIGLDYFF